MASSLLVSVPASAIPATHLPLLGIAPIALAFWMLHRREVQEIQAPSGSGVIAVAAATIANGADNLNVYIPLFATSNAKEIAAISAVFRSWESAHGSSSADAAVVLCALADDGFQSIRIRRLADTARVPATDSALHRREKPRTRGTH
ncbi:MAG: hypothetical protein ACT4P4_24685 [Betaproteobacteria bacterium]